MDSGRTELPGMLEEMGRGPLTERESLYLVAKLRREGWTAHGEYMHDDHAGEFRWKVIVTKGIRA
jgi:hypothetical protein